MQRQLTEQKQNSLPAISYARNRDPISIIYKERQTLDIKHQPKTWGMDLNVKFSKGERQMAKKHFYFIVKYP